MNRKRLLITAVGILVLAAACSSSKKGNVVSQPGTSASAPATTGSTVAPKQTVTVGVLTDLTGLAASGNKTTPQGVQAGAVLAARNGYTIKYVVADTTTSPAGALSAAQKLVEQDHVAAVILVSSLGFSAAPWLTSQGIPVIGAAEDGPEWITSMNMFSVFGPTDTTKVTTTYGDFFKMEGVTTVGSLGYSIAPSSAESAKSAAVSSQNAGLKVGYLNASFAFGSTNVQPIALAMQAAGVDGVTASVDANTSYALITALRQLGVNFKVALLPTGYGGDLIQAGPGALQAAQNVYFLSTFEPIEIHDAATQQVQSDFNATGITTDPTLAEYIGYTSVDLLVKGLEAAGPNPSKAALISALGGIHAYNAAGLFGSHTLDLAKRTDVALGVDNCFWITKLSGSTFQLVPGADPICGSLIPGKTVSPSS